MGKAVWWENLTEGGIARERLCKGEKCVWERPCDVNLFISSLFLDYGAKEANYVELKSTGMTKTKHAIPRTR
ncbi:hypothetical protein XENTR_v10024120 [Xenopus tropicalis]|nr:hypothetical protein XENTR_v10024120 [Xenopus tropicalis]KAE8579629.1 hypothetical protein XENTR_v10024120 [Xenopus tropicalis]